MGISIYAERIDVTPNAGSLDIDLEGVDLSQLISEVGIESLLSDIGVDEVKEWLNDKENE